MHFIIDSHSNRALLQFFSCFVTIACFAISSSRQMIRLLLKANSNLDLTADTQHDNLGLAARVRCGNSGFQIRSEACIVIYS